MAYTKYSLTPSSNTAAPPDGAPEGMLPSAVNDTMRDMMAQIRDCGDGIRGGTYTMTAPIITGGTINGATIGATTASTGKFTAVTNSALTSGRVTYAGTAGVLQDDADFTFNGTTVTMANDASISGLTVGKGTGSSAGMTVLGYQAGSGTNTTGYNTLIGYQAGKAITSGADCVALGYQTLLSNTTGTSDVGLGDQALQANTTGSFNTAVGQSALGSNTTASNNTAVGYQAAYSNTTGDFQTAIGKGALFANTTGQYNTALGAATLAANTTGTENTAAGLGALNANTTGNYNVGLGRSALVSNTTASNNTAVGYQAGYSNTTGTNNTIIGTLAGDAGTFSFSTIVGSRAGGSQTSGDQNTYVGEEAGGAMTTGSRNTIIGRYTGNGGGLDIRTASNHIVLSDGDGNPRLISESNGNVLIGTTTYSDSVKGILLSNNGRLYATAEGNPALNINRLADDGNLVLFSQAGTTEGSIAVSGTTVSYNGGHLARWSQLPDGSKDDTILKGTVLTNLDDMCVWVKDGEQLPNEQLNKMKVSNVEGDTNVAGVFVNWTRDEDCNSDDMNIAMTGDMIIRVADGVVVQKGDLLMSAGNGTAKPQGDDIVRSKTIAKVTSNYVTCTYADGSYCVPCVLMAC